MVGFDGCGLLMGGECGVSDLSRARGGRKGSVYHVTVRQLLSGARRRCLGLAHRWYTWIYAEQTHWI